MTQCSNKRRAAGLAYPRTCSVCGLGPCRETTALNPPEPTTNTVKHTPDAREWQDISTAPMNAPGESYGPWILVFHLYDHGTYQARYECHGDKRGWFAKGDPKSFFNHHITHWMPRPPAPQEKGRG